MERCSEPLQLLLHSETNYLLHMVEHYYWKELQTITRLASQGTMKSLLKFLENCYNIWDSRILNQFGTLYLEIQDLDNASSKYLWNRTCLSDHTVWRPTRQQYSRVNVFVTRALRITFGPKSKQETWNWWKLYALLYNLFSSEYIMMIKSKSEMVGHIIHMGEINSAYEILSKPWREVTILKT
jgi:hypothetical protein